MAYTVYRDFWPEAADAWPTLSRMVKAKGSYIFNPDKKRHQIEVPATHAFYHAFAAALNRRGLTRGRILKNMFVLQSYPGCQRQQFHYDFDPDQLATEKPRKKPQGVVLAIEEDGTTLDFLDRQESLRAGDLLVFDGDCVHAGSAYTRTNTRVHCYLDSCTHVRKENQTWFF